MIITLESLLNTNDNSINDTISLENDYSFDLSDYTIECSDIMCDINTLEAASIICEDENNKKNIFKKMIEKIRYLFKRLMEFFKTIIDKFKQRKIDKFIDAIISKIKKDENTQFIYTSNPYVDVLYEEKFDKNDVKKYVDDMSSFITNIQKSLGDLESHIAKNDDIKVIDDIFKTINNDVDSISETLGRSKFANAIKKYKEDRNEHERAGKDFSESPYINDEKANRMSKDELINRLSWIKTVYVESVQDINHLEFEALNLKNKCEKLYENFSSLDDTYLSTSFKNLQEIVKMIYDATGEISWLMIRLCDEVERVNQIG